MKNDPFAVIEKYKNREPEPQANITEGQVIAIEICSHVLGAHIWLAFDNSFDPNDGQAVFYADELPLLKNKTMEQLWKIFESKLAFGPETRVKQ